LTIDQYQPSNIKEEKGRKKGEKKEKKRREWVIYDKNNGLFLNGFFSFPFLDTTNSKVQALFGFNFQTHYHAKINFYKSQNH